MNGDIARGIEHLGESIQKLRREPLFVIVEDDDVDAEMLRTALTEYCRACQILTCKTGEQALAMLEKVKAAAVFLDLKLAGPMTGLDVMARVKEKHTALLVVIVTGLPKDDLLTLEALRRGATRILSKPVTQSDLKQALATI